MPFAVRPSHSIAYRPSAESVNCPIQKGVYFFNSRELEFVKFVWNRNRCAPDNGCDPNVVRGLLFLFALKLEGRVDLLLGHIKDQP